MEESSLQFFIDAFNKSDKERKIDLLIRIAANKNEKVLNFLVNCLGDEHWIIRKTASELIEKYGQQATFALSNAITSYNEDIQHWSLKILSNIGEKAMPALLRSIKSSNEEIRYFACNALAKCRAPQGVTALIKTLGDERWRVRKAASDALIQYGDVVAAPLQKVLKETEDEDIRFWTIKTLGRLGAQAQKFLLEALKHGDKKLRYVIAAALGESGDKRVIKVLIESLADTDWTIRKSATMALSEIGENAVELMIEYLRGSNEEIREGCLRALVKTGDAGLRKLFEEIIKMDDDHRYLVRNSIVKIGTRVVEPLMRLFRVDNPEIVSFAASALGEIGNPRAIPVLIPGLSHLDWGVRRSCAYALGEIGEPSVEQLSQALKSKNDDVRYWVTRILESIGEPGVPCLISALNDPNREIRYFAAKALKTSFNPKVARSLINSLDDESWGVRKAAAESICNLANLQVSDLIRHIASDNQNIRYWIREIIQKIGNRIIEPLIEAMMKGDAELRLCAAHAAGLISNSKLTEPLLIALRDDSEWVRTYAAISLGKTGDKRAIIPLIRSFSDRNTEIHRSIIDAFQSLGKDVYTELKKCIENPEPRLRSNAAIAFGEMRYESGIDSIILLTEDPDENVRSSAAEALGYFTSLKAKAILKEKISDKSVKVRIAAIKSLGRINEESEVITLMNHSLKLKEDREARTLKRTLIEMSELKPDVFIQLFLHESAAIKNLAFESLSGAGITVIGKLSEQIASSNNDNIIFWCKKTLNKIKEPKEISINVIRQ